MTTFMMTLTVTLLLTGTGTIIFMLACLCLSVWRLTHMMVDSTAAKINKVTSTPTLEE